MRDVDADPAALEKVRDDDGRPAAAERVKHDVALVAARQDDALKERLGLLGGVAELLVRYPGNVRDVGPNRL